MEVDGDDEGKGEREKGGEGNLRELEAVDLLTQDADMSGTTLVDACNGFN